MPGIRERLRSDKLSKLDILTVYVTCNVKSRKRKRFIMEFDFEREAMQGKPLPQRIDIADSCLYIALKNLYAMYQNKLISRKDATEEKRRLIYNWETDKSKIESLNRDSDILRAKIGSASEDYKNNPCVETADKLYAALYNLPIDWRWKK